MKFFSFFLHLSYFKGVDRVPFPIENFSSTSSRLDMVDIHGCIWKHNKTQSVFRSHYPYLHHYSIHSDKKEIIGYYSAGQTHSNITVENQTFHLSWNDTTLYEGFLRKNEYIRANHFGDTVLVRNNSQLEQKLIMTSMSGFLQKIDVIDNYLFSITNNNDLMIYELQENNIFELKFNYFVCIPDIVMKLVVHFVIDTYYVCLLFRNGFVRILSIKKDSSNRLCLRNWNHISCRASDTVYDTLMVDSYIYVLTNQYLYVYQHKSFLNNPSIISKTKLPSNGKYTKLFYHRNCILLNHEQYLHGFHLVHNVSKVLGP